ncbi:MAG: lipopolysaccharide biosynthesis protein [Candidatus Paceibacterales bacterium]
MQKIKQKIYNFLRWSQRYTGTDNIYLVTGGFWLTLGRIVSLGISFLLAIAYANFLDPLTFGNYKYILSLATILLVFSLPGMGLSLIQAVARGFEGGFYRILKLKIKYGILGSLVALSLAAYYFLKGNSFLPIPLLILGLLFPFFHAFRIYSQLLTGRKLFNVRFRYITSDKFISSLILILGLILLNKIGASTNFSLIFLITIYFLVPTIIALVFYYLIRKRFKPNKKEDPQTITYGKRLSFLGIIQAVSQRLDQILVFHYLGAAQVAIYAFTIFPVDEIRGFFDVISDLAFPKFSQQTKEELKKTFFRKVFRLLILGFIIMLIYILLAPFFYKILFPKYSESILYSQLFAISFLVAGGSLPVAALDSQMATKKRYILTLFAKITMIGLMFVLVLFYGILGIIIGRMIAMFLSFLLSLWLVKKL